MKLGKSRLFKDYKRRGNPGLLSRASNVYSSMNANALFPAPPTPLDAFKVVVDQLDAGMINAQHGDRLKAAQKNVIATQLVTMMDQLSGYVTDVANGDEVILLASGFAVNGTAASNSFGPVANFSVEVGPGSGNVTVSLDRVPGATSYVLRFGIDNGDTTIWLYVAKARRKFVVKNLQPGKTYVFKMQVIGTNDREVESETITKVVA